MATRSEVYIPWLLIIELYQQIGISEQSSRYMEAINKPKSEEEETIANPLCLSLALAK